jgi:hypothetical protein
MTMELKEYGSKICIRNDLRYPFVYFEKECTFCTCLFILFKKGAPVYFSKG